MTKKLNAKQLRVSEPDTKDLKKIKKSEFETARDMIETNKYDT